MGNNWYAVGYDGVDKEEAVKEQRALDRIAPRRVWMPVDTTKQYVFLDDEPFTIFEHQFRRNGNWRNWRTCLQGIEDEVPCCDVLGSRSRSFVGYYTVISCTPWTDKKGNAHQYELQLLPAKLELMKKLRRKKEQKGALVGKMYNASRDSDKGSSAGTEWEFERDVDLDKMFNVINFDSRTLPEWFDAASAKEGGVDELRRFFQISLQKDGKTPVRSVVPFNYFELLKPHSVDALKRFVAEAETDSNRGFGSAGQDDVPF